MLQIEFTQTKKQGSSPSWTAIPPCRLTGKLWSLSESPSFLSQWRWAKSTEAESLPQSREDGGGKDPRRPPIPNKEQSDCFQRPAGLRPLSVVAALCDANALGIRSRLGEPAPGLSRPWCAVPGRMPSPKPGPSTPGSLADFISPVFMRTGKGRDHVSGAGLAHGSLTWPATPDSPSELASDPLSRPRGRKSLDP